MAADNSAAEIAALIVVFERRLGVQLCIYDYTGRLSPWIPPDRTYHSHPYCRHVIKSGAPCHAFDHIAVEKLSANRSGGFFKRCHANVAEFAIPIQHGDEVLGVVLAGQFKWGPEFERGEVSHQSKERPAMNRESQQLYKQLPLLGREQANDLRTMMRAFVARLQSLLVHSAPVDKNSLHRKWRIENFLGRRFAQNLSLLDLSEELHVSPSRARHLVVELFSRRFSVLLREYRLRHSRHLLTHTSLSMKQIADRCRFCDANHFHKSFRRFDGMTPQTYRKQCTEDNPLQT